MALVLDLGQQRSAVDRPMGMEHPLNGRYSHFWKSTTDVASPWLFLRISRDVVSAATDLFPKFSGAEVSTPNRSYPLRTIQKATSLGNSREFFIV